MHKLFEIPDLVEATFLNRPNRFVAEINYNGTETQAHIHDPGRLKELLIPGTKILMTKSNGKLPFYIKAITHDGLGEWVLLDSALHNRIARKIFPLIEEFKDFKNIRSEVPLGKSRIDFVLDGIPLEIKGVSLVKDKIALFPDAPTKRGARHVKEIIEHNGMIMFLIFRNADFFAPNIEMDSDFSNNLSEARKKGVKIICAQIYFDGKYTYYNNKIPLADF